MLPIRFDISGVTSSKNADVRVNLKKEYRNLVYLAKPRPHQVPISFIGMPEPTAEDIRVVHSDESPVGLEIIENSFRTRARKVKKNKLFNLPTRSAYITDVTNEDVTGEPIPLFFKHTVSDGLESTPVLYDQEMREIAGTSFKTVIDGNEIAVFHELEPSVDPVNLRTRAYFIQYTNTARQQVFSMLQSEPAYKKATILDFPPALKRVYSVRDVGHSFEFNILYHGVGPWFVKIREENQLKIKKPRLIRSGDAWYVSIADSEIAAIQPPDNVKRYHIPEFHFQRFSPVEPTQWIGTRECTLVTNQIAKIPYDNLVTGGERYVDILLTDEKLNPMYGWSSRPRDPTPYWVDRFDRVGPRGHIVRFRLSDLDTEGITVQKQYGLVHFPRALSDTDRVFIRAYREVNDYQYLQLNLNPLHNRSMQTGRALIYCVPADEVVEDLKAIYHIILDEDNSIAEWNDDRLGEDGVLNANLAPELGQTGLDKFRLHHPNNLVLGSVGISRNVFAENLTYIDVREPGGKLTGRVRTDLAAYLETYPELQWVEDGSLHARPFPALGATVVDVPFEVLEEAGGDFTRTAVEEAVMRHMALGSAPLINYYADTPDIIGVEYDDAAFTLTVDWTSVPHADDYRLYVCEEIQGPFLPVDVAAVASTVTGALTATIGLTGAATVDARVEPQDDVYVYVVPLKNSEEWPASEVACMDVTRTGDVGYYPLNAIVESPPTVSTSLNAIVVGA